MSLCLEPPTSGVQMRTRFSVQPDPGGAFFHRRLGLCGLLKVTTVVCLSGHSGREGQEKPTACEAGSVQGGGVESQAGAACPCRKAHREAVSGKEGRRGRELFCRIKSGGTVLENTR